MKREHREKKKELEQRNKERQTPDIRWTPPYEDEDMEAYNPLQKRLHRNDNSRRS